MKNKINSFLPSIGDIFFISVFLYLAFSAGKGLLADCDTGYHIRAGEFIIGTLSVPRQDIFSFITPAIPWTAHEWLSEVIMALLHKAYGLTGVVIFFSFIIAIAYSLLFKAIISDKVNILAAAFIMVFVIASSEIHWLARPHIFSLLLTVVWYIMLDQYQYKDRNYLYVALPLMLLWVNLHGGFITGILLMALYIAGNIFRYITDRSGDRQRWRGKARFLAALTGGCLLVALINPQGYQIFLFPFKLTSSKFIMDNVSEFISPNFHERMAFTYLLFLMIAAFALSKKALNVFELTLMALFTYMALYSARYIPLFSIIAAPVLVRQYDHLIGEAPHALRDFLKKRSDIFTAINESSRGYIWPVVAVFIVLFSVASGRIEFRFDEKVKPVAAVDFLKREHVSGNMFDNDEFGDYIIYAAWPEYKVFFDGRSDMYGVDRMKEYFKVARIERGWEDVLKKYGMTWVIFDSRSALSTFLLEKKEWKLIYSDKVANIFVKDIPAHEGLIGKYRDVKPFEESKDNKSPVGR